MNNKLIAKAKKNLVSEKDLSSMNSFLFGFMSVLILSKEEFKKNEDIKLYLEKLDLHYKKYVYLSRTIIISRVIRDIEKFDEIRLKEFNKRLLDILNVQYPDDLVVNQKTEKNGKGNYVSKIIDKYTPKEK